MFFMEVYGRQSHTHSFTHAQKILNGLKELGINISYNYYNKNNLKQFFSKLFTKNVIKILARAP